MTRDEISAYFEGLNVQIDSVYKSFAVRIGFDGLSTGSLTLGFPQIAKHPDVENWEGEYYQAKLDDEAASFEVSKITRKSDRSPHILTYDVSNYGRS